MEKIIEKLIDKKEVLKINDNFFEIKTKAEFIKNEEVKIYLKNINGKTYFSDNKNTLRFMSKKYDLKSYDVQQSINDILIFYGFKIEKGELLGEIRPSDDIKIRYNSMLVCSCMLANMFIFFEELE